MVRVIGLSEEEKTRNAKLENMKGIASEIFPERRVLAIGGHLNILSENRRIWVNYFDNSIGVNEPCVLDDALKLAEAYEKRGCGEITVKKEYE